MSKQGHEAVNAGRPTTWVAGARVAGWQCHLSSSHLRRAGTVTDKWPFWRLLTVAIIHSDLPPPPTEGINDQTARPRSISFTANDYRPLNAVRRKLRSSSDRGRIRSACYETGELSGGWMQRVQCYSADDSYGCWCVRRGQWLDPKKFRMMNTLNCYQLGTSFYTCHLSCTLKS